MPLEGGGNHHEIHCDSNTYVRRAGLDVGGPAGHCARESAETQVYGRTGEFDCGQEVPRKVVGKTKLENEEGKWQYGVLVQTGKTLREVMVNARTGKIDSVEITTKAKEKTEEKADAAKAKKKSK